MTGDIPQQGGKRINDSGDEKKAALEKAHEDKPLSVGRDFRVCRVQRNAT